MTQTTKIKVTGSDGKTFYLYGRKALELKVWWENKPKVDASGNECRVEFYDCRLSRGCELGFLPGRSKSGYKRSQLKLQYF